MSSEKKNRSFNSWSTKKEQIPVLGGGGGKKKIQRTNTDTHTHANNPNTKGAKQGQQFSVLV